MTGRHHHTQLNLVLLLHSCCYSLCNNTSKTTINIRPPANSTGPGLWFHNAACSQVLERLRVHGCHFKKQNPGPHCYVPSASLSSSLATPLARTPKFRLACEDKNGQRCSYSNFPSCFGFLTGLFLTTFLHLSICCRSHQERGHHPAILIFTHPWGYTKSLCNLSSDFQASLWSSRYPLSGTCSRSKSLADVFMTHLFFSTI